MKSDSFFASSGSDDLSSHGFRQAIGWLGLVKPILILIIAGLRPTEGLPQWQVLGSVSAYYYTGAEAVFIGILAALGVFLITYRGYDNKWNLLDRITGIVAGIAAIGVAVFPTNPPLDLEHPKWWTPVDNHIHFISAAVLFSAFIFFCIFLFPQSKITKWRSLPTDKLIRNIFYLLCGTVILICMISIIIRHGPTVSIFWPEAIALEFFAMSWLIKGRVDYTLGKIWQRMIPFSRRR